MASVHYINYQPKTDLSYWKIPIDHVSATGHPIHFLFGLRIGFSLCGWGPQPHLGLFRTVGSNGAYRALSLSFLVNFIFVRCSRSVFNVWRHLNLIHICITIHYITFG